MRTFVAVLAIIILKGVGVKIEKKAYKQTISNLAIRKHVCVNFLMQFNTFFNILYHMKQHANI